MNKNKFRKQKEKNVRPFNRKLQRIFIIIKITVTAGFGNWIIGY